MIGRCSAWRWRSSSASGSSRRFVFRILKLFGVQFHPFWGKLPDSLEMLLKNLVELLAAIPSVVYGLWGIFVIIPLIRPGCNWLHENLGWFRSSARR